MKISPQTIAQIKDRLDVIDVVQDFVFLKKKGQNWTACCPFHNEKTPSFYVNPVRGIYKCFGCGKGGDAITFVMEIENYSYPEAMKYLAKKYNIEIQSEERLTDEEVASQNERESLLILHDFAQNFYKKTLQQHPEGEAVGLSYFRERQISDLSIEKFGLGYCLDTWESFTQEAQKKGFTKELLLKSGLTLQTEKGSLIDRFRGRVLFPIHNVAGRVIGFGGRILTNDKKVAKYINSPETPIYEKSNILYGISFAKKKIKEQDNCYLVEGYTDVVAMHQADIANVVASSGTSLTVGQIRLIKRFTNNITILYDGDIAGIKASLRGIDLLLEEDLNVKIVLFPDGDDPDSYAKKLGSQAFKTFVEENAEDFIGFKTKLFIHETQKDPLKRAEVIRDIVESIVKIPDAIKQQVFFQTCAQLLQIDEKALISEGMKIAEKLAQRPKYNNANNYPQKDNYANLPQKQNANQNLNENLHKTPEQSQEDEYFAQHYKEEQENNQENNQNLTQTQNQSPTKDKNSGISLIDKGLAQQERESVRILLLYGQEIFSFTDEKPLLFYYLNEIADIEFQHPEYAYFIQKWRLHAQMDNVFTAQDFFNDTEKINIARILADLLADKYQVSMHWEKKLNMELPTERDMLPKLIPENILRLKLYQIMRLMQENETQLRLATTPEEEDDCLSVGLYLQRQSKQITQQLKMDIFHP